MNGTDVPAAAADLAPGGTLRAGINYGNPVLVARGATSNEPAGIAPDLARQIAERLGVAIQFVTYDSAALMADDAAAGRWDIAFLGADPARDQIAFTAPYVELQSTYLVPAGSRLTAQADVDAEGVRVAARPRTAYDLVLRRTLRHAQLVYPDGAASDVDLLTSGKADALAGLTQVLADTARGIPGSRVLEGQFGAIQQAIGVPRERGQAVVWLDAFLADVKASGSLARAIEARGARGVTVPR
jgi:polar amino acid transport system substrate-binding protein